MAVRAFAGGRKEIYKLRKRQQRGGMTEPKAYRE